MSLNILIVEDQFIESNDLKIILERAGHRVSGVAKSVVQAIGLLGVNQPDIVLLDIFLQGDLSGIDLAKRLTKENIPFIYLSANSDKSIFDSAKATHPHGFLIKPFREKDILAALDIASYRHSQLQELLHRLEKKPDAVSQMPLTQADLGIVGQSQQLKRVMEQVSQVAPFDTTVLILGETGVGKEGIGRAIHALSGRSKKPFIKINCAAIPGTLIESELFGHDKGAFTGATDRRIGKFEQAQGGTIFLDEIGEIPIEIQSKLLRVLQEKEIERLGGRTTIKIDVRFIAATNRNLYKEVAAGKFRIDLYYRINVFPINLPPLRERKDDIPLLVAHFLKRSAPLSGDTPKAFTPAAMQSLMNYGWPGNIRELQHLVERHVLISPGMQIREVELPEEIPSAIDSGEETGFKTIDEVDKAHILATLRRCNGKVSGKGGAAEMLKIPSTTLSSKMKKLGIVSKY